MKKKIAWLLIVIFALFGIVGANMVNVQADPGDVEPVEVPIPY